ncbi:MAG: ribonuclease Z [Saprospiraceae bacterium]|nr:ribonuclease Z [Saprospiraceae bacterium]
MGWKVTVLGSNSAVPTVNRHPSAQVLTTDHSKYLIDCGEGTQLRLSEYGVRRSRIDHIFISHLHGDHIFGLPGLLTSYNLFGRTNKLHLHGPRGLRDYVNHNLKTTDARLAYDLEVLEHTHQDPKVIWRDAGITIETIPLVHRVPTTGYLFKEEVATRKINTAAVSKYQVPFDVMKSLQEGNDWITSDGEVIANELLTETNRVGKSFAYCSDTAYHEPIIHQIKSVDLLYHEATFLQELVGEAAKRKHSTAQEAALIAKKADVGKLMIGHFSSRYKDPQQLLYEAQQVFKSTILAVEGSSIEF